MHVRTDPAAILEASGHGIVATDGAGIVTFVNPVAQRLPTDTTPLKPGISITSSLPALAELVDACLHSGAVQRGYPQLDDRHRVVVSVTPVRRDRTVCGTVCTWLDAPDVERAVRELAVVDALDRKFRTVFDASSDGMWICDGRGCIVDINRATEALGGIKREEVIGKPVAELVERGIYSDYVTDDVLAHKRTVTQLQEIHTTRKTVLCTGIPVLDDRGEVTAVVINERDITQLHAIQEQLEELRNEKERYRSELAELSMQELDEGGFVAVSDNMRNIVNLAVKFAHLDASEILILGESGTGKGLLAKLIHRSSRRRDKPFIPVNCAALPENILEAELFGYEKGAFTGARETGKPGLIELAHGGTFFLDEIGEMPLNVQAKLLKYFDDHEIMRLGGTTPKTIDCTIIAATNQDLSARVASRRFRSDLYYRLNGLTISIPPLRERPEDVFQMTTDFLNQFNTAYDQHKTINPLTINLLQSYSFPGNVRELRNIIKKAVFTSDADAIDAVIIRSISHEVVEGWGHMARGRRDITSLTDLVDAFERELLRRALARYTSTRRIARHFNISQPTVVRKLRKHGLSPVRRAGTARPSGTSSTGHATTGSGIPTYRD